MKANFAKVLLPAIAAVLGLGGDITQVSAAETFPNRVVRIVVPAAAGGSLDIIARLVAEKMGKKLGQPVIIENRAGGGTLIGTRVVKDAPADGYTLLAQANGFTIIPEMRNDPGYDTLADFSGVGFMSRLPLIMLVGADDPSRNVNEFVERAKTDKLSFASGGVGEPPYMAAAMFLKQQSLDLTNVMYRGNSLAMPDVMSGRVSTIFDGYTSSAPYIQSGKLRPLAVTSTARIVPLPDLPTFKDQGIDYDYTLWLGLLVRSGTPKDAVAKLSEALQYATSSADLKERLINEGQDPTFVTPEEFNRYLVDEVAEMKRLVGELHIAKQ